MSGPDSEGRAPDAGSAAAGQSWRTAWLAKQGPLSPAMLGAMALVLGVLLMPLAFYRFQRDQSHFAYMALGWLNGLQPYADIYSHQFPGQLLLYAGIFKLFGVSEIAVRLSDLVLQVVGGLGLAALVARFTRPLTGLGVAILLAMQYVCLEPWNTSNRETFQIALLLPFIHWLFCSGLRAWLDKLVAFAAGVVAMMVLLIKPTLGLVFLPLLWVFISPGGAKDSPGVWRRRWPFLLLGMAALAIVCAALFYRQRAAAFESLLTFNLEVYAKVSATGGVRTRLLGILLFEGLYFIPFVFLVGSAQQRPLLFRLLAVHAGLIAAALVQGKGFSYQVWLAYPLCLFWTGLFLDCVVERMLAAKQREGERRPPWLASLAVGLLAMGVPFGNSDLFKSYGIILADPTRTQGNLAPLWDQTITWLRANVAPGERVFFFGHDQGVPFLMRIPPVTRIVAIDFTDEIQNAHPLLLSHKESMLRELEHTPPDWILVATYDGTWITRSGIASLQANRPLQEFLHERYERVPSSQTAYWVFHRHATAKPGS